LINLKKPTYQGYEINLLKAELNPICHLLALLEVHVILHVSRIRVKYLTLYVIFRTLDVSINF